MCGARNYDNEVRWDEKTKDGETEQCQLTSNQPEKEEASYVMRPGAASGKWMPDTEMTGESKKVPNSVSAFVTAASGCVRLSNMCILESAAHAKTTALR